MRCNECNIMTCKTVKWNAYDNAIMMSIELNNVFSEAVKIIKHVKANTLNSSLFTELYESWSYCMSMYVG